MTKTFGTAQTKRRTLEKSAACCEGWERNLFNQRDELFYDSLLCCVCLLFALFCLRLFNKHFMLECTEATKSFRVSFQPYISLACMLQLLDFLPQRRTQLFFPFFFHLHKISCSPLALFQLTHLSEGETFRAEGNARTLRSTLWFHQTHFNFRRDDEFKHFPSS